MGKTTIHCVRHAQGYHNLNEANHSIHDPLLTTLGVSQCASLSKTFPHPQRITHLVASPLRRTLYTCLLSFPSAVSAGLIVTALPELQETSELPCDTGSSPSTLEVEFGDGQFKGAVDLSHVHEGWNSKSGKWSPAASAIEARAREARVFLRELAQSYTAEHADADVDVNIVVVTHGGYLHYFTEDWEGNEKFSGTGWANCEYRAYEFVDARGGDEGASLRETRDSRAARQGSEKSLSEDEQRELRASAMREWQESGFQNGESAKL